MKKLTITILFAVAAGLLSAFISPSQFNYSQTDAVQSNLLNNEEVAGLLFMREEEKLAHDLYSAFYDIYGLQAFQNIAASELSHVESIKVLLEKYGVSDPAAYSEAGIFIDPTLQDLYNQLITRGSQSLAEALKVGAAVEEIDILDLQARIEQTSMPDIIQVYKNLEAGSRNHLRAYVSLLRNQTREGYTPGYLPTDEYQRIISNLPGNNNQGRQSERGTGSPRNN